MLWWLVSRWRGRQWRLPLCLMLAYGYGIFQLHAGLETRLPLSLNGETLSLQARVVDLPDTQQLYRYGKRQTRQRLLLDVWGENRWPGHHYVRASAYDLTPLLHAGDRLTVQARLFVPHGWYNQAGTDRARQALAEQVDARGVIKQVGPITPGQGLLHRRESLSRWLAAAVVMSPSGQAVLPALVVGDRGALTDSLRHGFQGTGTAHLLAISGLHVAIVAGWLWWLGRWLLMPLLQWLFPRWRRFTLQQLAWGPALAAAAGYAALAGFSLPTVRALIMLSLLALCQWLRVRLALWRVLGLALLIVLLLFPLSSLSMSLWLSFGAVAVIAWLTTGRPDGRLMLWLPVVMMVAGGLLFGQWSWSSPLANLLLVPLYAMLVIPLALLGTLAASPLLLQAAATGVELSVLVMQGLLALMPPLTAMLPGPLAGLFLLLAVLLWLTPSLPVPRRLLPFLLVPWLGQRPPPLAQGAMEVIFFDVGQGEAVVVRTRQHLLLYDTGPGWPGGSAADYVLLPWLHRQGLRPDRVIVSHGDSDHAGGVQALPAGLAMLSGEPDRVDYPAGPCHRGQHWRWDGVGFALLWPEADSDVSGNNASCVLQVRSRQGSVLLTGDIETSAEYRMLGQLSPVDLLQLPHHGSHSSSSAALLRALSPRWAVATVGFANRFHHPSREVVARLQRAGVTVLRTDRDGMIVFRWGAVDNAPLITRWRLAHGRPWHGPARWRLW
ncbi:DNA internalization-like protein [Alcanivorax hongdengensis A-11-3]|uniref:DNA internalization-like protein n=1 Tax=Alcanivorax hongdengensis A-11-3 TaxID=1177179 RepID=L0WES4_9GAMM|nr:DNA internalization-like protein [Alcanivorax hongdengensis A-11-3]